MSYKLATIKTDVPVDVTLDEMKLETPDFDALASVFNDLEFFTLKQRIIGSKAFAEPTPENKTVKVAQPQLQLDLFSQPVQEIVMQTVPEKSFSNENVSYTLVETPFEAKQLADKLAALDHLQLDHRHHVLDVLGSLSCKALASIFDKKVRLSRNGNVSNHIVFDCNSHYISVRHQCFAF